jgi:hypothetical protein
MALNCPQLSIVLHCAVTGLAVIIETKTVEDTFWVISMYARHQLKVLRNL